MSIGSGSLGDRHRERALGHTIPRRRALGNAARSLYRRAPRIPLAMAKRKCPSLCRRTGFDPLADVPADPPMRPWLPFVQFVGDVRWSFIRGGAVDGALLCSPPVAEGEQSMPARFEQQVAIVTGGAAGIGRAIVQRLADDGAIVVIADINEKEGSEVAETI